MTVPPGEEILRVGAATLRRLYNDARVDDRIANGELRADVRSQRPVREILNEPPGTLSQIIVYLDANGRGVAIVHQYLRPDGTLGASGRRDPKWLRVGARAWKLEDAAE